MFPKGLLITAATAVFLATATTFAIFWARGYRPDFTEKTMKSTGLLATNSYPTGAQVFIDGQLTTATNNTLNLEPGDYQLKIVKDGYLPWEKKLKLQKELVTQTNALLFPLAPSLEALTFTGVSQAIPSPDGQKIAYTVASSSAEAKNGLYTLQLFGNPLSFKAATSQIARATAFDFGGAKFLWSPDASQILVYRLSINETIIQAVLLETDRLNPEPYPDQTGRLPLILNDWEEQVKVVTQNNLDRLPLALQEIFNQEVANLYWSPTKERILYTATGSATIPDKLIPPLPASSTQAQNRKLEAGKVYVYDLKEDKNFEVGSVGNFKDLLASAENPYYQRLIWLQNQYSPVFSQPYQWFPDSQHLLVCLENKIMVEEYDGANRQSLYTGPLRNLVDNFAFVFPWPDASKLVILTSLNRDLPPNLYGIKIK